MEFLPSLQCRLCLGHVTSDNLIFSEEDEYEIPLSSKIMLCTSLVVSKNDDKSKYICSDCVKMIEMFFEFRDRCYRSHMQLCTNLGSNRISQTNDQEKSHSCKSVTDQNKVDKMVFELGTDCEDVKNEANVTSVEECDITDQMSIQYNNASVYKSYSYKMTESREVVEEHLSCTEELDEEQEVEEGVQELEEEQQQQQFKVGKEKSKSEGKELDEGEQEEVNKLEDILGSFHRFQVGCYVDLGENYEDSEDNSKSTLLRRFKCITCLKVFPSLDHLDNHWEDCERAEEPAILEPLITMSQDNVDPNSNNDNSFKENVLHGEIKQDNIVHKRQSYYSKNKKHVCELCDKAFPKVVLLRKHVNKEHANRVRNFACSICPKRFVDRYELKYHMRIHSDDDGFQCKECLKKFARPSALRTHERMHTGEKPYMCNSCPKKFTQFYSLVTHERIHTGEKPYICQYCSRAFTQNSSLKKHERLHAGGAKLFQCDVCFRMYADNTELELHRTTHNGELPWKCSYCEHRAFRKPSELSKHVHRFHTENHPFLCDLCHKSFISSNELKSHIVTHSSEKPFECSLCGKPYKNRLSLKRHNCRGEIIVEDVDIIEKLKD